MKRLVWLRQEGVCCSPLGWERSEFRFVRQAGLLLLVSLVHRGQSPGTLLLGVQFYFQPVPFNFEETLLLHRIVILLHQLLVLGAVLFFQGIEPLYIFVELLLIFLHALMMHLMEISLLEQLVISRLGLIGHHNGIVQLLFDLFVAVLEHLVFEIGIGYLFSLVLAILHVLVPLFLEGRESLG